MQAHVGACIEARSTENYFHLHFSVVWIGSRSTSVLALP